MTDIFEQEPFQLDQLPEDDQDFAIQMPYRVGMFISLSDKSGGDTADEQELKAIEVIVTSYAQDFCHSEFVQQVMNKTVELKDHWGDWLDDIEKVPEQCQELIDILENHLYDKEILGFKYNLFEIGRSVALAYREMQDNPTGLTLFIKKLKFYGHRKSMEKIGQEPLRWEEFLNVSSAENKALQELAEALGIRKNDV